MMNTIYNVRLVKELKGAPLSVLIALKYAGPLPVNQEWLECNTGYTDKPISQALKYLQMHGFIQKVGNGWRLAGTAKQMPLSAQAQPDGGMQTGDTPPQLIDEVQPGQSENLFLEDPSQPAVDSPIEGGPGLPEEAVQEPDSDPWPCSSPEFPLMDAPSGDETSRNFSDHPEVGQALLDLGILENHRTRRLLGRITLRDIRKTVNYVRDSPEHDLTETGLMITILEGIAEQNRRRGGYESWNEP